MEKRTRDVETCSPFYASNPKALQFIQGEIANYSVLVWRLGNSTRLCSRAPGSRRPYEEQALALTVLSLQMANKLSAIYYARIISIDLILV